MAQVVKKRRKKLKRHQVSGGRAVVGRPAPGPGPSPALTLPSQFVIPRWPQTNRELYWFTQAVFGIRIPAERVCPDHCSPFEAFADAYFARHPVTVWKASRGFGGKTRTLSALVNTEAVCLASECSILGGSSAQSLNVHAASKAMWGHHNAPVHLLAKDPTMYDTFLTNGSSIRSLMASTKSVRGPHPQRLRLDEIDEMDMDVLTSAQGQPMRKKNKQGVMVETQTVMSSTHQYPDKTMTAILKRAADVGWPIYQWCYRESSNPVDGWLSSQEITRQKQAIPVAMWETEYDLQEPSFVGRAFDTQAVEDAFDDAHYGRIDDDVWEDKWYKPSHMLHITGVDWAKKHDWTEIITFDARSFPWRCVAVRRVRREAWPYMIGKAVQRYRKYQGHLSHDATGIGDVVSDYIKDELTMGQRRMFHDVIMAGADRKNMFAEYVSAVESGLVKFPKIQWLYEEHKFCSVDDLFGNGHPPDGIVACAVAWRYRGAVNRSNVLPVSMERAASPWDLDEAHRLDLGVR